MSTYKRTLNNHFLQTFRNGKGRMKLTKVDQCATVYKVPVIIASVQLWFGLSDLNIYV